MHIIFVLIIIAVVIAGSFFIWYKANIIFGICFILLYLLLRWIFPLMGSGIFLTRRQLYGASTTGLAVRPPATYSAAILINTPDGRAYGVKSLDQSSKIPRIDLVWFCVLFVSKALYVIGDDECLETRMIKEWMKKISGSRWDSASDLRLITGGVPQSCSADAGGTSILAKLCSIDHRKMVDTDIPDRMQENQWLMSWLSLVLFVCDQLDSEHRDILRLCLARMHQRYLVETTDSIPLMWSIPNDSMTESINTKGNL